MKGSRFVSWTGALTADGQALADWLAVTSTPIPDVPALAGSLIGRTARYFMAQPDEAVKLWADYCAAHEQQGA